MAKKQDLKIKKRLAKKPDNNKKISTKKEKNKKLVNLGMVNEPVKGTIFNNEKVSIWEWNNKKKVFIPGFDNRQKRINSHNKTTLDYLLNKFQVEGKQAIADKIKKEMRTLKEMNIKKDADGIKIIDARDINNKIEISRKEINEKRKKLDDEMKAFNLEKEKFNKMVNELKNDKKNLITGITDKESKKLQKLLKEIEKKENK